MKNSDLPITGRCALCLESSELRSSHYLPAGVYRAVARGHEPFDKAPVVVDVPGKAAVLSNSQIRMHLLCAVCEGRFDKNGENIVIPQCALGADKFALLSAMKSGTPTDISRGWAVYNGPTAPPNIDGAAYQYFAASIFWRGSVAEWPAPCSSYHGALGIKLQEEIRLFLLGQAEFPNEARVLVFVDYDDKTRGLTYVPDRQRDEMLGRRVFRHSFVIPGVRFMMITGGALATFPDVGVASAERISFFEWHPTATEFEQGLFSQISETLPRGLLAKSLAP